MATDRGNRQPIARAPPVAHHGSPVKGPASDREMNAYHSTQYKQSQQHAHPSQRPHPRPQSSYKTASSSGRSPALSFDSNHSYNAPEGGIRDSTKVNIKGTAPRQSSARLDWESDNLFKSPKEPNIKTPKEQWSPQVVIRDQVDSQFENLLVCPLSPLRGESVDVFRTLYKFPMLFDKSFTLFPKTLNRVYSIPQ